MDRIDLMMVIKVEEQLELMRKYPASFTKEEEDIYKKYHIDLLWAITQEWRFI